MTEARPLPLPIVQVRSERCCWPVCRYNARAIRKADELVALLLSEGADVGEVIGSILAPAEGYEVGYIKNTFGPTAKAEWACFIADIQRARAAGHKTPEQVAKFLCPWSSMGQDDD